MAKIIRAWLISWLIIEAVASWWSYSTQKSAALAKLQKAKIRQEIDAWEKTMAETTETRNGLLQLAYLSWQIYEDDRAKVFWGQAFYLDPELVTSLPIQLF